MEDRTPKLSASCNVLPCQSSINHVVSAHRCPSAAAIASSTWVGARCTHVKRLGSGPALPGLHDEPHEFGLEGTRLRQRGDSIPCKMSALLCSSERQTCRNRHLVADRFGRDTMPLVGSLKSSPRTSLAGIGMSTTV